MSETQFFEFYLPINNTMINETLVKKFDESLQIFEFNKALRSIDPSRKFLKKREFMGDAQFRFVKTESYISGPSTVRKWLREVKVTSSPNNYGKFKRGNKHALNEYYQENLRNFLQKKKDTHERVTHLEVMQYIFIISRGEILLSQSSVSRYVKLFGFCPLNKIHLQPFNFANSSSQNEI